MTTNLFSNISTDRKRGAPTRDSITGIVYPSRTQVYKGLAASLGLDPSDQYGWYALCRRYPNRFIDEATGRPIGAGGSIGGSAEIENSIRSEVRVGENGRVVIPAPIRAALGLRKNDVLLIRVEEGRLVVENVSVSSPEFVSASRKHL